jgi:hypothetical protein
MRFQFNFARKSALWARLVVQPFNEESSVITLYYRILRGEAGKSKDEACFRVRPSIYDYIESRDPRHEKPIHKTQGLKTEDYLQRLQSYEQEKASGQRDEDNIPEVFESMFLHHHIYLPVAMSADEIPGFLQKILDDFRQLENKCSEKGQYPLGRYTFTTPAEGQDLVEQYLKFIKAESKATETAASPVLRFTPPKKFEPVTPLQSYIDTYLSNYLGPGFMQDLGKVWVMDRLSSGDWSVQLTLPLINEEGKEFFFERFKKCTFEKVGDNTLKLQGLITKNTLLLNFLNLVDQDIAAQLGDKYKAEFGKNWVIKIEKIEEADSFKAIFSLPAYPALKWQEWFLKRFPNSLFQKGEGNKGVIVVSLTIEDLKPENREIFMSLTHTSSVHPATLADLRI